MLVSSVQLQIQKKKRKIEEMDVGLNCLDLAKIHNQGGHLYQNMWDEAVWYCCPTMNKTLIFSN